jgi:hypothetical protein
MTKESKPLDVSMVKTTSLKERKSLVSHDNFSKTHTVGATFKGFLETLPQILAAKDFREVIGRIAQAHREGKTILAGLGAHVIKVGLGPFIIQLMEEGIVTAVALNGAGVIHDTEVAMTGRTSEDVGESLREGQFGMAEETARLINESTLRGSEENLGMGQSVGKRLLEDGLPYNHVSILAQAARLTVPVTVHVALGTDTVHMHPTCDGAAVGKASHLDFLRLTDIVSRLEGGVYMNIGSAVILPEVFLKALNLARNTGHSVETFTTLNLDFIRHYRPLTNVVTRPVTPSGRGYNLIGHHEIMVPLLAAAVLEELSQ